MFKFNSDNGENDELEVAHVVDVETVLIDPEDTIEEFTDLMLNANSPEELEQLNRQLFAEAFEYGYKRCLLAQMDVLGEAMHAIDQQKQR